MKRKIAAIFFIAATITAGRAAADHPQEVPEPMLVNLFALTEASASLQICANSASYDGLATEKKAGLQRLQGRIETLVRKIARKYDRNLFPFFLQAREDAAARPEKIEEIRARFGYCDDGLFERMNRYVYDSRQKLDYFLSQQPDAK